MHAVELKNVVKRFSTGTGMNVLFYSMNFQVSEGELVVVSGEKQTGKSTLLQMIAAMTPPNKGTVEVFGENLLTIKRRPEWRMKNIGFITNVSCLVPYLTTKQNLLLGYPTDSSVFSGKEYQAEQLLLELGFTDKIMNETYEGLTKKEQMLATIARIFMTNPRLILADDPTIELVGNEGQEVLAQLFRFARKKGSTMITVSNDPTITEAADRFFVLENCHLIEYHRTAN